MDASLPFAIPSLQRTALAPVLLGSSERVPQDAYQVLLIEHDETLARVLGRVFVRLGLSVYRADRLPEAAQLTAFDLLVVDADSLGRAGVTQWAMDASVHMPILVLTSDREALSTGGREPRFHVLEKPCFTAELRSAVELVCSQDRAEQRRKGM